MKRLAGPWRGVASGRLPPVKALAGLAPLLRPAGLRAASIRAARVHGCDCRAPCGPVTPAHHWLGSAPRARKARFVQTRGPVCRGPFTPRGVPVAPGKACAAARLAANRPAMHGLPAAFMHGCASGIRPGCRCHGLIPREPGGRHGRPCPDPPLHSPPCCHSAGARSLLRPARSFSFKGDQPPGPCFSPPCQPPPSGRLFAGGFQARPSGRAVSLRCNAPYSSASMNR